MTVRQLALKINFAARSLAESSLLLLQKSDGVLTTLGRQTDMSMRPRHRRRPRHLR